MMNDDLKMIQNELYWKPAKFVFLVKVYEYGKKRNMWVLENNEDVETMSAVLSEFYEKLKINCVLANSEKKINTSTPITIVSEIKVINTFQSTEIDGKIYLSKDIDYKIKKIQSIVKIYNEFKNKEDFITALGENPKNSQEIYYIVKCYLCKCFKEYKYRLLPAIIYDYSLM